MSEYVSIANSIEKGTVNVVLENRRPQNLCRRDSNCDSLIYSTIMPFYMKTHLS